MSNGINLEDSEEYSAAGDDSLLEGAKSGKKCTKCFRPTKGHIGPCGVKCINTPASKDEEEGSPQATGDQESECLENVKQPVDNQMSVVLKELVNQMSELNLTMWKMNESQNEIREALKGRKIGPTEEKTAESEIHPKVDSKTGSSTLPLDQHDTMSTLPAGVKITQKTKDAALRGEFVNLSEFLQFAESAVSNDLEPSVQNGILTFAPRKPKKCIESFHSWLMAWNSYEQLLISEKPELYNRLVCYRRFIQSCDVKFMWHATYSYDCRFRAKLAQAHSFQYDQIDYDLYITIFDTTAVRRNAKTCFRCKSLEHSVQDCPFPSRNPMEENKKGQKGKTSERWFHNNTEGCNNYQSGKCVFPGCKRAHVCRQCRGSDPFYKCATCGGKALPKCRSP